MAEQNFGFLSKIPDQCGYMVLEDGAIIKSDGDLSNREYVASIVGKLLDTDRFEVLPNDKFYQMTVHFGTHFYTLCQSGRFTYVVKRKSTASNSGSAGSSPIGSS